MSLPLPRVIPDVGPGGNVVTAMGGINSLANNMLLQKINAVKAKYAPLTTQAEAASKLAYANLMAPQFIAKAMNNPDFMGNLSEEQKNMLKNLVLGASHGSQGLNQLNQMPQGQGMGNNSSKNFLGHLKDNFLSLIGKNSAQGNNAFSQSAQPIPQQPQRRPKGAVMLEGQQWYDKNGNPVYEEETEETGGAHPMEMTLTEGMRGQRPNTYAENAGAYKGNIKEGEELGKYRAQVINDIGQQQMQLSNTGANLDRIVEDINAPEFRALRNDFPFYQDMQLKALSKVGSPEQQEMIGHFIADVKSFAGATVNSFKGQSMKREFDYAEELKPSEKDTVNTARGKLTALKELKEIAEKKNDVILNLMQNKHLNLGDAVKQANKMVDVKAIDKQVKELTQPLVTLKNKKTGQSITVTLNKARELGVPNV